MKRPGGAYLLSESFSGSDQQQGLSHLNNNGSLKKRKQKSYGPSTYRLNLGVYGTGLSELNLNESDTPNKTNNFNGHTKYNSL